MPPTIQLKKPAMNQKFFDRVLLGIVIFCFALIFQIKFIHYPLNPFHFSEKNIESTNDIIFEISIAIIAAYIFYVINIQLVSYFREKKSRELVDVYLRDIMIQMYVDQLYLQATYFNRRDLATLTQADFNRFTTFKNMQVNFSYIQVRNDNTEVTVSMNALTEIDIFYEERDMVKDNINVIFTFPFATSLDYELINVLQRIRAGLFYIGVDRIKNGITFVDFEKYMFEHHQNFLALTKFVPIEKANVRNQ
ncbi:MAG: hypothetical protein JSS76_00540 [Bacteroidetes bacterium]|nr:hypothetical protein [Bacteroidota bacterium]